MEINVINVPRHKPFSREAKFCRQKKMDEKSRFGELFTEEIKEILDNAVPVTTKKLQSSRLDYLAVRIR